MNKRIVRYVLILIWSSSPLWGQNDDEHPITDLFFQHLNTRFTLCGSLTGMGSTASLAGESVVWRQSDASCLVWNPAALGNLDGRSLFLDYVPGLTQNLSKFYDMEGLVQDEMDSFIEDYGTDESEVMYPTLSPVAGFHSNLSGFGLAIPFRAMGRRFGVGFGYTTPFLIDLQIIGSGIEVGIDSEQDIQGEMKRIRMRTRMNLNGSLNFRIHRFVFGAGGDLGGGLAIGFSVSRLKLHMIGKAYAGIDGIVEMSGAEYAFNDPYDPRIDFASGEQNDLNQSFFADYSSTGWGVKFGAIQRLSERIQFGATVSFPPKLEITGLDSTVNNRIPFINFEENGDGISDLIDPEEIDLAKLTLTERIIHRNELTPVLELPTVYNVGFIYENGIFSLLLRYTIYEGGFSFGIIDDEIRGLRFRQGAGLGLDFTYFFLGASADFFDEIVPEGEEALIPDEMKRIPIPKLNLGFRVPLIAGLWADGLIGIEPTPLLRITARYDF